jgi:SSS family solute:Na+ symporter
MVFVLIYKAGGPVEAITAVAANYPQHIPAGKQPSALIIGSLIFMTSFGTWGLPQMVQKFYAVKNEKVIGKAALITTVFALIIGVSAYTTGALSHVFFDLETIPRLASGKVNYDLIVPTLLTAHLPEALLAIIMLLVLSASMSTLSSLILVSSSAITIDLYKGYLHPEVNDKQSLLMIRILSGVFIVCSYLISKFQVGFIVTLMSLSWGVLAGAFMAPYILGIFWKRVTKMGAYAGFFSGAGTAIALFFVLGPAMSPLASSIAMVVPFLVVPLVSLATPKLDENIIRRAFEA